MAWKAVAIAVTPAAGGAVNWRAGHGVTARRGGGTRGRPGPAGGPGGTGPGGTCGPGAAAPERVLPRSGRAVPGRLRSQVRVIAVILSEKRGLLAAAVRR